MAIAKWPDSAIVYLLNKKMVANIIAAQKMMGKTNSEKAYTKRIALKSLKCEI